MNALLEHCAKLDRQPRLAEVARWLADAAPESLRESPDATKPYGRDVLFETEHLEAMVATWTRGVWCAPHDHGGSVGGVRVLRGAARHRIHRLRGGTLELVREERVAAGAVLSCGADLVHAMADGGADESLMTLHLYAGPIDHMVVYDLQRHRTLVVDGGCGAWVPDDESMIRSVTPGLV